jgi:hypothetical protein
MNRWIHWALSAALVTTSACSAPSPAQDWAGSVPTVAHTAAAAPIDRAAIRQTLADHRAQQIAHLHAYGAAGQFPHNTTTAPSLHMFRDPEGRLCAVANLVQTDGRGDLVEATVRTQNDLAIADVHDGAMMDWVTRSGLTQEELVAIQLPAPVLVPRPKKRVNVAKSAPSPEEQMNAVVASHVASVEAQLRAATEESLDVAVERYVAAETKTAS